MDDRLNSILCIPYYKYIPLSNGLSFFRFSNYQHIRIFINFAR